MIPELIFRLLARKSKAAAGVLLDANESRQDGMYFQSPRTPAHKPIELQQKREGISFLDNLACHFESVFFSKIRFSCVSALRRKGHVYFDSDLYMAVPTEQV